jgi:hypothetical protein
MPVRQARLSREKQAIYVASLRQLQEEGRDVEIPEEWEENGERHSIDIVLSSHSVVFETACGGIKFAVQMRITALRSGLTCVDCDISTAWDDQIVAESDECDRIYRLDRQEYRPHEVLNQKIENNLKLRRGEIVEGWILAGGLRPVPAEYGDHSTVPFEVKLFDQFETEYSAIGTLTVLRNLRQQVTHVGRGRGLYDRGAVGQPTELSISEQSALRHSDGVTQMAIDPGGDA